MWSNKAAATISDFKTFFFAFQLIDDWLDFRASAEDLGKPSRAADLKLGLATAPGNENIIYSISKASNI